MKKVLLLFSAFMLAFVVNSNAQPPQMASPEDMAKRETESMKTELKLTNDQAKQVEAVNLKYAQKMGEMFQQGPPADFAEAQKKMGEIQKQKRVELSKILTPDQLTKYDKMLADRRANMPGPPM